jgi:hypothetical protein
MYLVEKHNYITEHLAEEGEKHLSEEERQRNVKVM